MIVHEILRGIDDDTTIVFHLLNPSPINELVQKHNRIATIDDRLQKVDEKTTGAELKLALSKHEPETQVMLMYDYIKAKEKTMHHKDIPPHIHNERRTFDDANQNLGRRASDRVAPIENIVTVVKEVSDKKDIIEKEDKAVINTSVLILIIVCIILFFILMLNASHGDGNQEKTKGMLETVIEVIKLIFE